MTTPQTDSISPVEVFDKNGMAYMADLVDADFARKLERALADSQRKIGELRKALRDAQTVVADRASGGNMLTPKIKARDLFDRISALLKSTE